MLQFGFTQSMLVYGGVTAMRNGKPRFGEIMSKGFRGMLWVAALGLLMSLCIYVGMIIFLIPGIILALCWAVVLPAQIMERKGLGSFGRSMELTRNNRFSILGFSLIMLVVLIVMLVAAFIVVAGVMAVMRTGGGGAPNLGVMIGVGLVAVVLYLVAVTYLTVLFAMAPAALYVELTNLKGGVADVAKTFE
jgi:hypothetical protein